MAAFTFPSQAPLRLRAWHAWLVLLLGLLTTGFAGLQVRDALERDAFRHFSFICDRVSLKISERLEAYALILRGSAGLLAVSGEITRDQWRAYVAELQAERSVTGVQGVGFAKLIPAAHLAEHIADVRREGFPTYDVRPAGLREAYTSIVFLEPFSDRNLRAFGYDMFSEPVRRAAMAQARDSGEAALSGKVELVQETGTDVQAGTLMYVPVYRKGNPHATLQQRRQALVGWAYSPYRMSDLMGGILAGWEQREGESIALRIYDGHEATLPALLFASKGEHVSSPASRLYQTRTIEFNGRNWLLEFDAIGPAGIDYASAWKTWAVGLALSGLLFGLMISLTHTRARAGRIAEQLTESLRAQDAQLRESEAFKASILDSVSSHIAVLDRHGVIVAVNEPWRRFARQNGPDGLAMPRSTDIGTDYLAVSRPLPDEPTESSAAQAAAGIRAVLDGSAPSFHLEYACATPARQCWFGMTVTQLGGERRGAVVAHTDITDRRLADERVRESERMHFEILESVDAFIYLKDTEGRYLFANRLVRDLFGKQTHEIVGRTDDEFFDADTCTRLRANDHRVLVDGITLRAEEVNRNRNDQREAVYLSVKLPLRDASGRIHALCGISTDITERKQVEQIRKEALDRLEKIASQVPGVVFQYRMHADGRFSVPYASAALSKLYRLEPEQVRDDATAVHRLVHPEDREHHLQTLQMSAAKLTPLHEAYRLNYGDGAEQWVLCSATPQREADGSTLWHGFITDITDAKRTQAELERLNTSLETLVAERTAALLAAKDQAEAANRAKSAFLANMSHEFRTPLNGIIGMSYLMRRGELVPAQVKRLDTIETSGRRLLSIVESVFELTRLDTGAAGLELEDFELSMVVKDSARGFEERLQTQGFSLQFDLPPEVCRLRGDVTRLRRCIVHYLDNAIRFAPGGRILLRCQRIGQSDADVLVRFEVSDTGEAVSQDVQHKLFTPFQQVDESFTRAHDGAGLGLVIVRRTAQLMGGDAGLLSQPGAGNTFWFTARLALVSEINATGVPTWPRA